MKCLSVFAVLICLESVHAATHIWASFDGNFGAASSWNTGKAPSEWLPTDNVLFNGNVDTSVTSGLDQSGVRVASILVHDEYMGAIGSIGSPLAIAADVATFRGAGLVSYRGLPTPGKLNFLFISPEMTYATYLWGQHDWAVIKSGWVAIQPSAVIDTLFIDPVIISPSLPNVTVENGPSIRTLIGGGGVMTNKRDVAPGHTLRIERGDFLQTGVIENGARLEVQGGFFTYDPFDEPPSPGPTAEFQFGYADFSQTFYELHFAFGIVSVTAEVHANQALSLMGLIDLNADNPSVSFVDRGDSDGDGVWNVFDHCVGDSDGDCVIDMKDFAAFQNSMSGP